MAALGAESLAWWRAQFPGTIANGTLVVAHARDTGELLQFGRRTTHFESVPGETIAALEPELAGRFSQGLYFKEEGHLDPRAALTALAARLAERGVPIRFSTEATVHPAARAVLDCRGL